MRRSSEDPADILEESLHDFAQVVMRRSCGDPREVLSKRSLHDPVQILNRKSCGDPGEVLSKRSLHEELAGVMSSRCLYEICRGRLLGSSCIQIL